MPTLVLTLYAIVAKYMWAYVLELSWRVGALYWRQHHCFRSLRGREPALFHVVDCGRLLGFSTVWKPLRVIQYRFTFCEGKLRGQQNQSCNDQCVLPTNWTLKLWYKTASAGDRLIAQSGLELRKSPPASEEHVFVCVYFIFSLYFFVVFGFV